MKVAARVNPVTDLVDILRTLMIQGHSTFGLVTDASVELGVLVILVLVAPWLYPTVAR